MTSATLPEVPEEKKKEKKKIRCQEKRLTDWMFYYLFIYFCVSLMTQTGASMEKTWER